MSTLPTPEELEELSRLQRQANQEAQALQDLLEKTAQPQIEMPVSSETAMMAFFSDRLSRIEDSVQDVNDRLGTERQAREVSEKEHAKQIDRETKRFIFTSILGILTLLTGAVAAIAAILALMQ